MEDVSVAGLPISLEAHVPGATPKNTTKAHPRMLSKLVESNSSCSLMASFREKFEFEASPS